MKLRTFTRRSKVLAGSLTALVAAVLLIVPGGTQAALGDDRETKAYSAGVRGFDQVQFNSFTGVPGIGDERNFFTGMIDGASGGMYDPMNNIKPGDTLLVRVYVHNNADPSLNAGGTGVAKNTRVRVALPTDRAGSQSASAFISADNAQPETIEDTLSLSADTPFGLQYVAGSARIKSLTGSLDAALSDAIVTDGVVIGSQSLNGDFRGGFDNQAHVTLKMRVTAPAYTVEKTVRKAGTETFGQEVTVKPGDRVDFSIGFRNSGTTNLSNVVIGDRLPVGLTYVPGSTQWNSAHTNNTWTRVTNDDWLSGGLDLSGYGPGGTVFLRFSATVANADALECGQNQIVNHAFARPKDQATIQDSATVKAVRDCAAAPAAALTCDLLDATKVDSTRTVTISDFKTTASGGATFKDVVVNWGDGTETMTDSLVGKTHQYGRDGTYVIRAVAHYDARGTNKTAESESCARTVTFTTPVTPAASTTPTTPATTLPETGAASVAALFAFAAAAGFGLHKLYTVRKYGR